MSDKLENLKKILDENRADYTIYEDDFSLASAEEGAKHYGISLHETTPTLILKAGDQLYAAIICGDTRISFKKLKLALDIKTISLADPKTIQNITGANIGEISLINLKLPTIIDSRIQMNENCYGGCGFPQSTLRINTRDLIRITNAAVFDFTDLKD